MLSSQKGLAYILNVQHFDLVSELKTRRGSEVDLKNMEHLFTELGYTVKTYVDLNTEVGWYLVYAVFKKGKKSWKHRMRLHTEKGRDI